MLFYVYVDVSEHHHIATKLTKLDVEVVIISKNSHMTRHMLIMKSIVFYKITKSN